MTMTAPGRHARTPAPDPDLGYRPGPLGRLGVWVTDHARLTTVVWILLIVGLGAFAPKVESQLSGAGWQADGSESVAARQLAQDHFGGNASSAIQVVVHSTDGPVTSGAGKEVLAKATAMLKADSRIADVIAPQPGATLSQDGKTAVLLAGAGADPNEMVRAADDLKGPLQALSTDRHPGQPDRRLPALVGLQRGQPRAPCSSRRCSPGRSRSRSSCSPSGPWSPPDCRSS